LRIIAGKAKGLKLKTPKGNNTRPTSDRVKESVFNILSPFIENSVVLDLFSGTGNLSIESISRNASKAYLVEKDRQAVKIIKENIEKSKFNDVIVVLNEDVFQALRRLGKDKIKFNIIFMDPPYLKGLIIPCIEEIIKNDILEDNGLIVIEHDSKDIIKDISKSLSFYKEKKYGNTLITILKKEAPNCQ